MNLGYSKFSNSELNNQVCPICGSDIYVPKRGTDFLCVNKNCTLNKGATKLVNDIKKIIDMI